MQHQDPSPKLIADICRFAKEKNKEMLTALVEGGYALNCYQGVRNPIILLAEQGDVASVDFLIKEFELSINNAIEGYACGGYLEQVEALIEQGADPGSAIFGYARGGYVARVEALLLNRKENERDTSRVWATLGYAHGGYVEQVEELIARGVDFNLAAEGYALAGRPTQVNDLVVRGADHMGIVANYIVGGYLDTAMGAFHLMALTDNDTLRRALGEAARKKDSSIDVDTLMQKTTMLNQIINKYQLNFDQALILSMPKAFTWLLTGCQLIATGKIDIDSFYVLTTWVLRVSRPNAERIFCAVFEYDFSRSMSTLVNDLPALHDSAYSALPSAFRCYVNSLAMEASLGRSIQHPAKHAITISSFFGSRAQDAPGRAYWNCLSLDERSAHIEQYNQMLKEKNKQSVMEDEEKSASFTNNHRSKK